MKRQFVIFAVFTIICTNLSAQEVSHLTDESLKQFILSKPLVVIREKDSASVRLEFKDDGTVYQNTFRTGQSTVSTAGTWKFNDKNIKICLEFQDINSTGFCFGVMREGSQVRLFTGPQKKPTLWGTVKVDE